MIALVITLFHNTQHFAEYRWSGERAVHDIREAVRNERMKHNKSVTQRGFASVCNSAESSRHTRLANGTLGENFGHLPRLY